MSNTERILLLIIILLIPTRIFGQEQEVCSNASDLEVDSGAFCKIGTVVGTVLVGAAKPEAFETLGLICEIAGETSKAYKIEENNECTPFDTGEEINYVSLGSTLGLFLEITSPGIGTFARFADAHGELINSIQDDIRFNEASEFSKHKLYGVGYVQDSLVVASVDVTRKRSQYGFRAWYDIDNFDINIPTNQTFFNNTLNDKIWYDLSYGEDVKFVRQKFRWSIFSGLDKRTFIPSNVREVYFSEESRSIDPVLRLYFMDGEKQVGQIIMTTGAKPIPPARPSIKISEDKNSLSLNFTSNTTEFKLQKSIDPSFNEVIQELELNNEAYEDLSLEAGKYYYYRVAAINEFGISPYSEIVTGRINNGYKFENIAYEKNWITNEEQVFSGVLVDTLGNPVPEASISLNIPEYEWDFGQTTTNAAGEFQFLFRAPSKAGNEFLELIANVAGDVRTRDFAFTVSEPPYIGRNLAIRDVSLNKLQFYEGELLTGNIQITNLGREIEPNTTLRYSLTDEVSNNISSVMLRNGSVPFGETIDVPFQLDLSTFTKGVYSFRFSLQNEENLDESPSNNVYVKDFYLDSLQFSGRIYQTQEFELAKIGESISIFGNTLLYNDISSAGEVEFIYSGESSGFLTEDPSETDPWFDANETIILFLKKSSTADSTISIRAGQQISNPLISSPFNNVVRSSNLTTKVLVPSGEEIISSSISFPFGDNSQTFNTWNLGSENSLSDLNSLDLNLYTSLSGAATYNTWMAWEGSNYKYYGNLQVKIRPKHDIDFIGNAQVLSDDSIFDQNGNVFDPIAGMDFQIRGEIQNTGDFREIQILELSIGSEYGYSTRDFKQIELDPGETYNYNFNWPSVGLDPGVHAVTLRALHSEDQNGINSRILRVNLIEPPLIDVSPDQINESFDIGQSVPISVFVGRNSIPIPDAEVNAKIESPTGLVKEYSLSYDPSSGRFKTYFPVRIGGNYYIEINALKKPYKKNSSSFHVGSKVYVELSEAIGDARIDESESLSLMISPVGNLFGFKGQLVSEELEVRFEDYVSSDLLKSTNENQVSDLHEGNGGIINFGSTILGQNRRGIDSFATGILGAIRFIGLTNGNGILRLEDFGLIDSYGNDIPVSLDPTVTFDIRKTPAVFDLAKSTATKKTSEVDTIKVALSNAYNVRALKGLLNYDPSFVEILKVEQLSGLNDSQSRSDVLIEHRNDRANGKLHIGIATTGEVYPDNLTSRDIAQILFRSKKGGQTNFSVESAQILSSVTETELPIISTGESVTISGSGVNADTSMVFISPKKISASSDSTLEFHVRAKDASNFYSFAGDVFFEADKIEVIEVSEGGALSNNGSIYTSFSQYIDQESGRITLGVSRLEGENIDTLRNDTLITIRAKQLTSDSTTIVLSNVGLIRKSEDLIKPLNVQNGFIQSFDEAFSLGSLTLQTPLAGESLRAVPVRFSWSRSEAAENYQLQVSADSLFSNSIFVDINLTDTLYTAANIDVKDKLYWRVKATNQYSEGEWITSFFNYYSEPILKSGELNVTLNEDFGSFSIAMLDTVYSDPEGGQLSYSLEYDSTDVAFAEITDMNVLKLHSLENRNGKTEFELNITDQYAFVLKDTINLEVLAVNDAPFFEGLPDSIVVDTDRFALNLREKVKDIDNEVDEISFDASTENSIILLSVSQDSLIVESNDFVGTADIMINAIDIEGDSTSQNIIFDFRFVTSNMIEKDIPNEIELIQNYPNPFNPTTNIQFSIPAAARVELSVYNLLGQKVATLFNKKISAGLHTVQFDARSLSSGVYIYLLKVDESVIRTRYMTLIK